MTTVAPQADKPRARNMFNTWKWTSENDLETTLDTNSKRSKFDVAPAFDEEFKDPQRLAEMRISGFVIDPRKSKWSGKWDLLMIACLFFTAVVTPVEIVFLDEGAQVTALWIVNRVIDFCFCLDMIICFFLAFQRPASWGGYFVVNQRVIVCHYLSGWFIIDFVSVLPIWLVTLDYNNPWAYSAASAVVAMNTSSSSSSPGEDVSIATLPRIIRLMRLVKLARVLKASRVLQRNILDILMHEFGTTYAFIKVAKLISILIICAHWQACLWGLGAAFAQLFGLNDNWIVAFDEDEVASGRMPSWFDRYTTALYWSVMTLTSIGYGDVTPHNTLERFLSSVCMLASGMMWTYAIGTVATIASTLNPQSILFTQTMDSLNNFMRERALPKPMRFVLRTFFESSRLVRQKQEDQKLLDKMSPLLQCTVAVEANRRWIRAVWYLRPIERLPGFEGSNLIMRLSRAIIHKCYIHNERLPLGQLYILSKGVVVKNWRFYGVGRVWGEDILLEREELVDHTQAVALVYTEVLTLGRTSMLEAINIAPEPRALIRSAIRKVAVNRSLLMVLLSRADQTLGSDPEGSSKSKDPHSEMFNKKFNPTRRRRPMSFCPQSFANGYEKVDDSLSIDQKLDHVLDHVLHRKSKFANVDQTDYAAIDSAFGNMVNESTGRNSPLPGSSGHSSLGGTSQAGAAASLPNGMVLIDGKALASLMSDVAEIKQMLRSGSDRSGTLGGGFFGGGAFTPKKAPEALAA